MNKYLTLILLGTVAAVTAAPACDETTSAASKIQKIMEIAKSSPLAPLVPEIKEKMMKMGKMIMKYKMMGNCFKFDPPANMLNITKKCGQELLGQVMRSVGKNFGHPQLVELHKTMMFCYIDGLELYTKKELLADNLQSEKFMVAVENMMKTGTKNYPESYEFLMDAVNSCRTALDDPNPSVYQRILKFESCKMNTVFAKCAAARKDPGIFNKINMFMLNIVEESRCDGKVKDSLMIDPYQTCIEKQKMMWIKEMKLPAKFTLKKENKAESVRESLMFIKNFTKIMVAGTFECVGKDLGTISEGPTSMTINFDRLINVLDSSNIVWTNEQQREKKEFLKMVKDCKVDPKDEDIVEINDMMEYFEDDPAMLEMLKAKSLIMQCVKFKMCFAPKFVKTCGLNSEVAKLMFPFLNFKAIGLISSEFVKMGGPIAGSYMFSIGAELMNKKLY